MKKTIVFVSLFVMGMNAWAQDTMKVVSSSSIQQNEEPILKTKRGYPILPVAGDWSVSAGTSNLFGYVGNLFADNNTYNPSSIFSGTAISVGYFKTNRLVYNMSISIASQTEVKSNYVTDDSNPPTSVYKQVKDNRTSTNNNVFVKFGLEKRFGGQRRIQRFIGAGLGLGWRGASQKIEYGNEFASYNQTPTSSINPTGSFFGSQSATSRIIQYNEGTTVSADLYVSAGAEYFFAPKMSLGLTFSVGPRFSQTFNGSTTLETYSPITSSGVESKFKTGTTSSLNIFTSTSSIYFRLFF